jgi:factor associated with neutral sphingomyelinase activation
VFGYQQTGDEALKAKNVFHPLTYEGKFVILVFVLSHVKFTLAGAIDVDKITNPIEKASTIAQIDNFGQTPKKLFSLPHPPRTVVDMAPTLATDFQNLRYSFMRSSSSSSPSSSSSSSVFVIPLLL